MKSFKHNSKEENCLQSFYGKAAGSLAYVIKTQFHDEHNGLPFRFNLQSACKQVGIALPSGRRALKMLIDRGLLLETNTFGCYSFDDIVYLEAVNSQNH